MSPIPRCCGGASCACRIEAGQQVTITGIGSSGDPFVISSDVVMNFQDNATFDFAMTGAGTDASPWVVTLSYAATASLDGLPDVASAGATNGQVLAWNSSLSRWQPAAPTTAASGSVQHDTSLSGDGSGGSPLQVREDSTRFLSTNTNGLGITDAGVNQMVRRFPDAVSRAAASPAPGLNTLSVIDSDPGKVDYWNGSQWNPAIGEVTIDGNAAEMLQLSGAYDGRPAVMYVRNFSGSTDLSGVLTVVPNSALTSKAGILSATIAPTGSQPYTWTLAPTTNSLTMVVRRVEDGALLANQTISGQVTAYLY